MSKTACRTAILISGSGSNLQAFIDQVQAGKLPLDIALVLSNRSDAFGLERATSAGLPTACISHRDYPDRERFDRAIAAELEAANVELIILAGFMRILSPWFVQRFAGRILNIHPALLPAYPGLDTHQRVLDNGDQWHGSTVHFVTEELDAGPLIMQGRVRVAPDDTAAVLAARVQAVEHQIYPQAAALVANGRVRCGADHALLDGAPMAAPLAGPLPAGKD